MSVFAAPHHLNTVSAAAAPPFLEVRDLGCVRGGRRLFRHVNFTLEPGKLLQVDGANGSGKTTLLRILAGLAEPAEGEVRVNGETLSEARNEFLQDVAYLGHAHGLKPDLSPLENLAYAVALNRARPGVSPHETLRALGLERREHLPCRRLSEGQRRRTALARLLCTQARLWLLDEPFTAVDRHGVIEIKRILRDHVAAGGMAALTTHHAADFPDCEVVHVHLSA
jgi:heme exporter protein A